MNPITQISNYEIIVAAVDSKSCLTFDEMYNL